MPIREGRRIPDYPVEDVWCTQISGEYLAVHLQRFLPCVMAAFGSFDRLFSEELNKYEPLKETNILTAHSTLTQVELLLLQLLGKEAVA